MLRRHLKRYKPLLSWYRKQVFGKPWQELSAQPQNWQNALSAASTVNDAHNTAISAHLIVFASHPSEALQKSLRAAAAIGIDVSIIGLQQSDAVCSRDVNSYCTLPDFIVQMPDADWFAVLNAGDTLMPLGVTILNTRSDAHPKARIIACDYYNRRHGYATPVFPPPWAAYSHSPTAAFGHACWYRRAAFSGLRTASNIMAAEQLSAALIGNCTPTDIVVAQGLGFRLAHSVDTPTKELDFARADVAQTSAITLIIPTRDNSVLLSACIDSLLKHTEYSNYQVLIVDNQSRDPDTLSLLSSLAQHPLISVARYDAPFNYAAINNWAADQVQSEYLVFLNDDVEIESARWLSDMLAYAQQETVGAVGCKLLYGDRTIQHAGVAIGTLGGAAHKYKYLPEDAPGYFNELTLNHAVSAVTAACLMMRRTLFTELGGFDADNLTVAFNDIDLCLKASEAGKVNIVCNRVVHLHHESKSRGEDLSPEKAARFAREKAWMEDRWQLSTARDPFIHAGIQRRLNQRYNRKT